MARYQQHEFMLEPNAMEKLQLAVKNSEPVSIKIKRTGGTRFMLPATQKQIMAMKGNGRVIKFTPAQLRKMQGAGIIGDIGRTVGTTVGTAVGAYFGAPQAGKIAGEILGWVGDQIDNLVESNKEDKAKKLIAQRDGQIAAAKAYLAQPEETRREVYAKVGPALSKIPLMNKKYFASFEAFEAWQQGRSKLPALTMSEALAKVKAKKGGAKAMPKAPRKLAAPPKAQSAKALFKSLNSVRPRGGAVKKTVAQLAAEYIRAELAKA